MRPVIKVAKPYVNELEVDAVRKVLYSGQYISGKKVKKFEDLFAEYIGINYCVAVNSGTAALQIALIINGIGPGDEVIVPPLTFFSTISSVLHQGAIPIFADINRDSWCLDPEDVERKITEKTKALIPVHLYGNVADMEAFKKIGRKYKLLIIEDAAQAHGAEYKGIKAGAFGNLGCFSFFATKHMTTGGEGGAITTNNSELAKKAKCIRSHGMIDRNTHKYLGYNYRMTELEAAMGIIQLKRMPRLNKKRTENSLYLLKRIEDLNIDWIKIPQLNPKVKHAFFWCPILINESKLGFSTKRLKQLLLEAGIETRSRYLKPLNLQPILSKRYLKYLFPSTFELFPDYQKIKLPLAEEVAGKIIGLPNRPDLTKGELDYILKVIKSVDSKKHLIL